MVTEIYLSVKKHDILFNSHNSHDDDRQYYDCHNKQITTNLYHEGGNKIVKTSVNICLQKCLLTAPTNFRRIYPSTIEVVQAIRGYKDAL